MTTQELKVKRIEKTSRLDDINVNDAVEILGIKPETQRDKGVVTYRYPSQAVVYIAVRRDSTTIEINSYFVFQNEVNKGGRRNVYVRGHPNYQHYDKMLIGVEQ